MTAYTRLTRPYWRAVLRSYRAMRRSMTASAPKWLQRRLERFFDHVDLHLLDHGVFRLIYPNRHRLSSVAWRSAQPAPRDIRVLARRGVRTIVNLRGDRDCGSYRLEQAACKKYGVRLVNFSLRSRQVPDKMTLHAARALVASIEYPALFHCKSGADRVGLMSVLFMIFQEGRPVAEAKRQLSWKYGHISQAETGVLDQVFETYLRHSSREPIPFLDWVDRHYDPETVTNAFKARSTANFLVNSVMRRE